MRLVSVVTRTRPPFLICSRHSASRSSTWPSTGRISVTGSISPVGRITCSAKVPPVRSISHGPGVALTKTVLGRRPPTPRTSAAGCPCRTAGGSRIRRAMLLRCEVAADTCRRAADGHVAFVHDQQRVLRQVFEQRRRRLAGLAAGQIAGVVLDALAEPVVSSISMSNMRALLQPLRLQQPPGALELVEPLLQLALDA